VIAMGVAGVVHENVKGFCGSVRLSAVPPAWEHNTVPDVSWSLAHGKMTPQFAVFFIHTANVTVDDAGIVPPRLGEFANVSKHAKLPVPVA
jgi:hypothetical protein